MVIAIVEHGGTQALLALFNEKGEIIKQCVLDLPNINRGWSVNDNLPEKTIEIIYNKLNELCKNFKINGIDALGYSGPGPVTKEGTLIRAPNVWGNAFNNIQYLKLLEEKFNLHGKVVLENDMTAAAAGFMRFAPKKFKERKNFCIITVSTGIGSKCVNNGKIIFGKDGLAGEIGHIPILNNDEIIPGYQCGCGKIHCLEAGSSGNANAHRCFWEAKQSLKQDTFIESSEIINKILQISTLKGATYSNNLIEINMLFNEAVHKKDPLSLYVLKKSINPLARAIAIIETQYNVGKFYLIGGFALGMGQIFLDILKNSLLEIGIVDRNINDINNLVELGIKMSGLKGIFVIVKERIFNCNY